MSCLDLIFQPTRAATYSAETLILEDDSLSLDNNCSHSSGSDSSGFKSPEDDDLDEPIPTYQMSQKMVLKSDEFALLLRLD